MGTKKKTDLKYEEWKATHQCNVKHEKSSGSMEASGAVEKFPHSVQKHKLVCSQYLGDDDTSSFKEAPS